MLMMISMDDDTAEMLTGIILHQIINNWKNLNDNEDNDIKEHC